MCGERNVPSGTAAVITCSEHSRTTICPHVHEVISFIFTWISFLPAHLAIQKLSATRSVTSPMPKITMGRRCAVQSGPRKLTF